MAIGMNAQSLSDSQVTQKVAQLYSQGKSEMEIAKQLISQGATVEQLQRIQKQYQNGNMNMGSTSGSKNTNQIKSGRIDNGEMRDTTLFGDEDSYESLVKELYKEQKAAEKRQKAVFGHDIFQKRKSQMQPQMNQATPKNYVLGAGDEVIIDVYGASQVQWTETISPDGKITIKDFGPVHLAGLSIEAATRRLKNTVGQRYQNSHLSLSVGQTRSITVNVMGEVETPGSYQLSAFATPMNALFVAGGVTKMGTLRNIKVYRDNKPVNTIDIYGYLMDGKWDGDQRLEDGDVIIVGAYEELVQIRGKVKRPMYYEMAKGETVDKLLYYAGGFAGNAWTDGVRVLRRNGNIGTHTVQNAQFGSFALMDGDSIGVDSIIPRLTNTVSISGAVFRSGQYGISENLKTIKQLVEGAGLTERAYIKHAVLYRMKLDRTLAAVSINLEGIMNGTVADIELKNEDQLFIPSEQKRLEKQFVIVHGEVFKPDTFKFAENETVEDLILRAGGLTEKASTSKVDVSRRIFDADAEAESKIKSEIHTVKLNKDMEVGVAGFTLEPFDEVYVRQSPAYGKQMNVSVRGEILFDGTYALKTQDDRLSDLVKAAGGLTSHAYAAGARLQRTMTEEEKLRRDQLIKMNKGASSKDSVSIDKLDLEDTYFVGIDLQEAIKNPGSSEDIVLREGDVLMIPSQNTTVKINGEVCYPNTVSYISGKRALYYINQAGGYSSNARRLKAYVIYPNGKVGTRYSKIQPGSEIVVPSRPEKKSGNAAQAMAIASSAASIASVAATIVTLIINTRKDK